MGDADLADVFEEVQRRGVAGQVATSRVRIDHGRAQVLMARQALDAEFAHRWFYSQLPRSGLVQR